MSKINSIIKNNLCLGCGLCESIFIDNCEMKVNSEGFYIPEFIIPLTKKQDELIVDLCPGVNIVNSKPSNNVWGESLIKGESWSTDEEIRHRGSSGGFISGLASYLLDNKIIDGVLHVGVEDDSWLYNKLTISKSKEDIISKTGSRYAPAKVFNDILKQLDEPYKKLLFIGKPCDIYALNNLMNKEPKYRGKIFLTIAFFCAGIPSYNATKKLVNINTKSKPSTLRYRGNGWPGNFTVKYENNDELKLSYKESWGNHLGKDLNFRCKICPDGIGLNADISVGDSWEDVDGYPSFTNKKGRSFVIGRSLLAKSIILKAAEDKTIVFNKDKISFDTLSKTQKYQYERRVYSFYRYMAVFFKVPFLIKFKNLKLFQMVKSGNLKRGLGNFLGTIKRL